MYKPSLRDIEWVVCTKFNLTRDRLQIQEWPRRVARPRQIAMFLARELNGASFPKIGSYFDRDHTTVLYAVRRIRQLIRDNPKVADHVEECRSALIPVSLARSERELRWACQLGKGIVSFPACNDMEQEVA